MRAWMLILLLTVGARAQSKYFLPYVITQSNGRPYNSADVDLYTTGTTTKVYDLTYLDNSGGSYYTTSQIATGTYDIYVNGLLWRSGVYINTTEQSITNLQDSTRQNLYSRVADTTALKALTRPDSVGATVFLESLSSSNAYGGGLMVRRSSGSADGITTFAASGGGYWVRVEKEQGQPINVEWAGAVPGSGDDITAIQNAANLAMTLDLPGIYLPEGTWNTTDPIYVPTTKGQNDDFQIIGAGRFKTTIVAADTAFGRDRPGYTRGLLIRDMTIQGPGKGTAGSIGLWLQYYTNPKFSNIYIENFEYNVKADKIEGTLFEQIFTEDAVVTWEMSGGTLNGNTWLNCYNGSVDSAQYRIASGYGNRIQGGEAGNCPIFLEMGVDGGGNFGQVEIDGMNIESVDSTFVIVYNLSSVKITNTRLLLSNPANITYFAYVNDDSKLFLDHITTTNQNIYAEGNNSRVILGQHQQRSSKIQVYHAAANQWTAASTFEEVPDNAVLTPDSTNVGRMLRMYSRKALNTPERFYYYHRYSLTEFARTNLLNGSDWRGATTDVQGSVINNVRYVVKYFNVTFSASGDSTEYTAIADTNGWTTLYYADLVFDDAGNAGKHNVTTCMETSDGSNGTGTIDWLIWHNGDATLNGVARRFRMIAILVPREWGSN